MGGLMGWTASKKETSYEQGYQEAGRGDRRYVGIDPGDKKSRVLYLGRPTWMLNL